MVRLKIVSDGEKTFVKLDEKDLANVISVTFKHEPGHEPMAHIQILKPELELELNGDQITIEELDEIVKDESQKKTVWTDIKWHYSP